MKRAVVVRVLGEPVRLHGGGDAESGHPRVVVGSDQLHVRDDVPRRSGAGRALPGPLSVPAPRRGDRVHRERDGRLSDGVIVQLEAGRRRGHGRLDQARGFPDRHAAEVRAVRIRLGEVRGVRLDHAVDEELDAGDSDQRAREAGPHLRRRLQLLAQRQVGVEHHVEAEPRRQLVGVLEPPVRVEHGLPRVQAGLVHERGAVAPRELSLEVPQRLAALLDGVLRERPLDPGERLVEQPFRRTVRKALDDGAGPAGILPADAGAPQQLAVDPLRVDVVVVDAGGAIGHGPVERLGRHAVHGDHGGVPASATDGRQLRVLRGETLHPVQTLLHRQAVGEAYLEELPGGEGRMHVRVGEARQDEAAAEVHGPRARTGPLGGLHRAPQRRDPAVPDGQGLHLRAACIDGTDAAVGEDQVGFHCHPPRVPRAQIVLPRATLSRRWADGWPAHAPLSSQALDERPRARPARVDAVTSGPV